MERTLSGPRRVQTKCLIVVALLLYGLAQFGSIRDNMASPHFLSCSQSKANTHTHSLLSIHSLPASAALTEV